MAGLFNCLLAVAVARGGVAESPGLAPHLLPAGARGGGAIRGVLGDCEPDHGVYHGFVPEGEAYHCSLAGAEVAFKDKYYPQEELCDWGFGELIPHPSRAGDSWRWTAPGAEWGQSPGAAPGTTAPAEMFRGHMCAAGGALLGGETLGRLMYQQLCERGLSHFCGPRLTNMTEAWPCSMGIYRITPQMASFMKSWRMTYHRPNIAFGDRQKYYGGWVRKVVKCADIPEKLLNTPGKIADSESVTPDFSAESAFEFATRTWLGMESLLTAANLTPSFISPGDWAPGPVEQVLKPNVTIRVASELVTLTISGMATKWFGIGFNASRMSDHPHAVIVDGDGAVSERRLDTYHGGEKLPLEFSEVAHSVVNGVRTVVLQRAALSKGLGQFSFPQPGQALKYIWAVGIGPSFATHEQAGPAQLEVTEADVVVHV